MSDEHVKAMQHRQKAAVTALFDYLFLVKYGRLASYWEARLGEALVHGEIVCNQPPSAIGLRQVHQVAAEVAEMLLVSEVMIAQEG
jgi:hypothetical protein